MNLSQRMRREVAALERPLHGGDGWRHQGTEDFSANPTICLSLQIVAATRNALVAESLAEGGRARHEDD